MPDSSHKDNIAWQLDLLEVKFLHTKARYRKTKVLLNTKVKANLSKKFQDLLLNTSRDQALEKIKALKTELCERKFHAAHTKLVKSLTKIISSELNNCDEKRKELLQSLDVEAMVHAKITKIAEQIFTKTKELKQSPPEYLPEWCQLAIKDPNNKYSPKFQYKNHSTEINNIISKFMNNKEVKKNVEVIESSFKLILGPVVRTSKNAPLLAEDEHDNSDSEVESSDSSDDNLSDSDSESEKRDDGEEMEIDEAELDAYKDMIVATSDEEAVEEELNPQIDYNQVTDEEPSDTEALANDDFFDFGSADEKKDTKSKKEKKEKKEKVKLPALASGYFSGGESDSDIDKDEVVQNATKQRKNRRGQRARQKIWEAKYGKKALHVQKEHERVKSERERKQAEFEERERKRREKALLQKDNEQQKGKKVVTYSHPAITADDSNNNSNSLDPSLHPSWVAKKKAEELKKNLKFSGKKITFD